MGISLNIEGREALAIRSIPYVTAWRTSPAELVRAFTAPKRAMVAPSYELRRTYGGLFAYQMDDQGVLVEVPPRQWQSLLETLNAQERLGGAREYEVSMRLQSVLELPDNVFVWMDNFQAWFLAEIRRRVPLSVLEDPDPEDVADWLDDSLCLTPILPAEVENNIWRYAEVFTNGESNKQPRQRQQFQEEEILRAIKELGYTAMALRPNEPGKGGVKSELRVSLKHHQWSQAVFDKAWERLLASNLIQYTT